MLEFGSRRAQGARRLPSLARALPTSAAATARPARISDQLYGVSARRHDGPFVGADVRQRSMRPSSATARCIPTNAVLLVDTYNTLKSGVPERHPRVQRGAAPTRASRKCGIRLDSGDMTYLTKKARKMLDEAGWTELRDLRVRTRWTSTSFRTCCVRARRSTSFGVGERLITAKSEPVFGGVYKLVAVERRGRDDRCRRSRSPRTSARSRTPHFKKLYRFYGADTGKAIADYLCLHDETVNDGEDLEIFDPEATWKRKKVYNFHAQRAAGPRVPERRAGLPASDAQRNSLLLPGSRSTHSGTRSSDLTTRIPTMWTSLRSSGRSNTVC